MIWILFALLIALVWAITFILQLSLWIPLLASGIIAFAAIVYFIFSTIRARRSASALERALAEEGKKQAMHARPERRAEIQALQKQLTDGISALKSSKLGGKKRGSAALYSLPWYAIIGPPGAGKTTALKHSGLVFPYADSAVRGVGGTRNCDWWFTNDAILLDTAGRYATETEDMGEWLAFLDMLRKYRSNKPLNGLIIAVSVTDILDSNEADLELMGKKLRARIDEVMTKLRMTLPVYLLVTKCDLIAGFVEFFGSLRKSERAQPWGATLTLKEDKSDPGAIFGREFDLLVQQAHGVAIKRLAQERNRVAREAIFQFPLELAGLRRNLEELLSQVFMVNAFQGTPTFRGFYLTSGTQEGLPLNRVLQRMGQAMGIQPQQFAAQQQVESKSYFLHDVFTKVMFPDADVAARSISEQRRKRLVRVSVSGVALVVAILLAVPSAVSFYFNQELLEDTKKRTDQTAKIDWEDGKTVRGKLEDLDPVLDRLKDLDKYDREGPPSSMRFMMYSGDRIYRPTIRVYVANMQQGFVKPCKYYLERRLKGIEGKQYVEERAALKTYLMLSDVQNLDVEWATGKYTALWAELQKSTSDVGIDEMKKLMRPHVRYYFELIKPEGKHKPRATPVPANEKIVTRARKVLQGVPVRQRYYALFVESVSHELYDPSRDKVRSNLQFPPVSLETMFTDRPEVLQLVSSKQYKEKKKWLEVPGPYTDKGHYAVIANIKAAGALLEREQWVVPLTAEERGDRVMANVAKLKGDYEQKYITAWNGFLGDLAIQSPANLKEAIDLYAALQKPEWPYLRVLRALEDHTQWNTNVTGGNAKANQIANQKINRALTSRAKGLRFGLDVNDLGKTIARVPNAFKKTVGFGVPLHGGAKSPLNETSLAQYMELLGSLREKMVQTLDDQPEASVNIMAMDLQKAVTKTEALLQPVDDAAKRVLLPLLQLPLNVGGKIRLNATLALKR